MARTKSAAFEQLQALADDPGAQSVFAVTLLDPRNSKDVMQASLAVLAEHPIREARAPILRVFAHYGADKGMRDQGGYFRRHLLTALRPLVDRSDAELLAQAATTYEFWPPDFHEDAVLLRAAALIALAEANEELGRYHAARLLVDPYVQPMSGEPAVTAARVLGAFDELTVLWAYVFTQGRGLNEVTGECLRQMLGLPEAMLPQLLEQFSTKAPAAIQLGLVDLLIYHHSGPHGLDYLRTILLATRDLDIYRYIVMTIVASGREPVLEELLALAGALQDKQKLLILEEALKMLGHQPRFAAMAASVHRNLGNRERN